MGALPWIAGLGVLAVGGAVYLRSRKAAPSSSAGATDCDRLAPLGEQAVAACKAAQGAAGAAGAVVAVVGGALDAITTSDSERHAENVAKNGPVVETVHPRALTELTLYGINKDGARLGYQPLKRPYPLRHRNGCVPLHRHPGWKGCAPGTHSMVDSHEADGSRGNNWWAQAYHQGRFKGGVPALLSGDPARDVLTFRLKDGTWIVRGQPVTCPPGTEVRGRDHRPGESPCVPVYGSGPGQAPHPVPPPTTMPRPAAAPGNVRVPLSSRSRYNQDPDR